MRSGLVSADLHMYGVMWMYPVVPVSDMLPHQGVVLHQNHLFARMQ